ncbi:diguanylate cyclase (GGDEF) domain-containing protein [Thermoactinomyces sp. DSM 45891]|uniref:ATP-binding protein n=1 Tax=Thermoactinomyces sp. DSM 45891 TaxID=1761907 RepID=UPI00091D26EE|nr:ATP-binding protein [Thermoactinomyces sp. DSM 45891]SFX30329.1 diguanylate cyclase (GGDEF) domain-containing protein [Thermoactinomyces sp. DSM 45891]
MTDSLLDETISLEAILWGCFIAVFIYYYLHNKNKKLRQKNQEIASELTSSQLEIQEMNDEIEEIYRRDYLTGLYNLGGFQDAVVRSLERMSPLQSYHVVSIDLADFKQVNLREGVDFGDQILIEVASQFQDQLPTSVHIARYDGDQFAIGLTGDHHYLRRCVEIIDKVMSQICTERVNIEYCIGTASYPAESANASELIRLAEKRLSIEQRRMRDKEEEKRRHMEKLSAVGQLAAGLAHEIRNPLTSIRGFVQISAAESTEVKKWESIILPEIDRINDLLTQFLNLSESRPTRFQNFHVDQLISDIYSLLKPKVMLMGHELVMETPKTPIYIEADPEKLKQVLINLIQNGLDALVQRGQVDIKWYVKHKHLSIEIQDTGAGIKPEFISRIYEPFFTTKDEGTGMGLAICHRIIQDHGGSMRVESRMGKGTTFHLSLPLKQEPVQVEEECTSISE